MHCGKQFYKTRLKCFGLHEALNSVSCNSLLNCISSVLFFFFHCGNFLWGGASAAYYISPIGVRSVCALGATIFLIRHFSMYVTMADLRLMLPCPLLWGGGSTKKKMRIEYSCHFNRASPSVVGVRIEGSFTYRCSQGSPAHSTYLTLFVQSLLD